MECVTRTERGPAYRVILDYAAGNDVDLVAMSTHGRTGIDRYLPGSVTGKVVRLASVPVLTVRVGAGATDEEGTERGDGETVVP